MTQYNKVTIIIENDDEKVTMQVPVTADITIHEEAVIVDDMFREKKEWPRFQPEIMDLTINMRGFFSEKDGHLYVMKRESAVKDDEDFPTDDDLHRHFSHPDYDYKTTSGQRKRWDEADMPPEGDGWERNLSAGRRGWDRFDYHEESYWKRKKA